MSVLFTFIPLDEGDVHDCCCGGGKRAFRDGGVMRQGEGAMRPVGRMMG